MPKFENEVASLVAAAVALGKDAVGRAVNVNEVEVLTSATKNLIEAASSLHYMGQPYDGFAPPASDETP